MDLGTTYFMRFAGGGSSDTLSCSDDLVFSWSESAIVALWCRNFLRVLDVDG
jgi:hypothetical protein